MDKLLETISELLPTIVTFGLAYYLVIGAIFVLIFIIAISVIISTSRKMNKRNRF